MVKGFGLKVTPAGGKVYVFQYRIARPGEAARTPAKRYTIGKHGSLTPDEARTRAKRLAGMVENGIDPRQLEMDELAAKDEAERLAAEKARQDCELAFENVAALWLDHYENERGRRPSSFRMAKLVVNRHLKPRLGVRFEVTEAVLNHVSGARAGVAGIYQRHDWKDEKRGALDAWAKHVAAITAGKRQTENVVPIRAGGAA